MTAAAGMQARTAKSPGRASERRRTATAERGMLFMVTAYTETESHYESQSNPASRIQVHLEHKYICMCLSIGMLGDTQGSYVKAGDLLRVLAAPARLAIVVELAGGALQVNELVDHLGLSQPLVSQHLRVLRGARLVAVERRGREATYSLVAHIVADALQHGREGMLHDVDGPPRQEVATP
jgi:ArsR family transcriptional regulator, zinc-responsive transcriptional repressor